MLLVRPNVRKMRAFRDSPSESALRSTPRAGIWWERVLFAAGAIGVVVVAVIALGWH